MRCHHDRLHQVPFKITALSNARLLFGRFSLFLFVFSGKLGRVLGLRAQPR
jgi:hypothetical protein